MLQTLVEVLTQILTKPVATGGLTDEWTDGDEWIDGWMVVALLCLFQDSVSGVRSIDGR